jgi:hypothetical protein
MCFSVFGIRYFTTRRASSGCEGTSMYIVDAIQDLYEAAATA